MSFGRDRTHPDSVVAPFYDALGELGCIACRLRGIPHKVETQRDHINVGGLHGQKTLGDLHVLALCQWHHMGRPFDRGLRRMTVEESRAMFGPSRDTEKVAFDEEFGDPAHLLMVQEMMLKTMGVWREEWRAEPA